MLAASLLHRRSHEGWTRFQEKNCCLDHTLRHNQGCCLKHQMSLFCTGNVTGVNRSDKRTSLQILLAPCIVSEPEMLHKIPVPFPLHRWNPVLDTSWNNRTVSNLGTWHETLAASLLRRQSHRGGLVPTIEFLFRYFWCHALCQNRECPIKYQLHFCRPGEVMGWTDSDNRTFV